MTIDQMQFASRIFLGLTIVGVLVCVCLFFLLEIGKAIQIVSGRTYKVRVRKTGAGPTAKTTQAVTRKSNDKRNVQGAAPSTNMNAKATTVLTRVLDMNLSNNPGSNPTTVLEQRDDNKTTLLRSPNNAEMLVDITFVHAQAII